MKLQLIFDKKSYFSEGGVTTVVDFFDHFGFYTRSTCAKIFGQKSRVRVWP